MRIQFAFLTTVAVVVPFLAGAAGSAESTQKLTAVLKSGASIYEKARACQQLGEIGTAEAVPVLAALLADPQLNAYARSGLEGIAGPDAAAALRKAAATLRGPLLAGVINSLGVLQDAQSVGLLSRLATDASSGVTSEALMALGNISSPEAIEVLQQWLSKGLAAARNDAAAACLLAADRQRLAGNPGLALKLYESLRSADLPAVYRAGAVRGAILARNTDRVAFLLEQLRSGDLAIRNAALLTVREIPDDALATALNSELPKVTQELQGQLLLAIADCHNAQSVDAVGAMVSSSNPEIRRTALTVLGRLGPTAAPALIIALQQASQPEERTIVLAGLRGMAGTAVNDRLREALRSAGTSAMRIDLIRLLESRGAAQANDELLRHAAGPDPQVSIEALSALKSLGGSPELPALIALAKATDDASVRDAAGNAIAGVCSRSAGEPARAEIVLGELQQARKASEKNCWVRVLASLGYAKALPAIEGAASDPDQAVAENAVEQMGRWPDPTPVGTLLKATEAGVTPALRQRALLSVIDLAGAAADERQRPEETIVEWLKRADAATQSITEKRRILGVLGRLPTAESYRLMSAYLDHAELKVEAASGVVQIAPTVADELGVGAVKPVIDEISRTVENPGVRDRAARAVKILETRASATQLFDGRALTGWEGDTNVWRVRDGVIVGGSMAGNPRNEFLVTRRSFGNFVLRLEYKLVGTEGFVNSGVQFRSVRVTNPPNEMSGYQADIGAGYSGCLYDETRRNKFLARCSDETIKRLEKPGEWNRYEVRCEGTHIQIWLNGEKTVDYAETDGTIPQKGFIGLQIHGGNKAEVSFRNIAIQEL